MSDKPKDTGYIESSVGDRYSSMKVPSVDRDLKHEGCTKITDQAAGEQGHTRFKGEGGS